MALYDISGAFGISPSEVIGSANVSLFIVNNVLDYENLSQRKFIILLTATETLTAEKFSSTATLEVKVKDINDNVPTFDQSSYSVFISESAVPGTTVTTIKAKDRDSGDFGVEGIIYSLEGEGAENFVVENTSGIISVAECNINRSCLDFETKVNYFLQFKVC